MGGRAVAAVVGFCEMTCGLPVRIEFGSNHKPARQPQPTCIPFVMPVCDELDEALEYLESVKDELRAEGVAFREDIPLGIMVEVPSAALIADRLSKKVDFLSIGTNDLIQYTLAVDRMNEEISYLYQPMHPSVLRLIQTVVDAASGTDTSVSVCGEMAANPAYAIMLIGLGVRDFSMNPVAVPKVKQGIRAVSLVEARELAQVALERESAAEIEEILQQRLAGKLTSR